MEKIGIRIGSDRWRGERIIEVRLKGIMRDKEKMKNMREDIEERIMKGIDKKKK